MRPPDPPPPPAPPSPTCPGDAAYAPAVAWGRSERIAAGNGDGTFAPEAPVTREQLAVMVSRYAALQGRTLSDSTAALNACGDAASVSQWARTSVAQVLNGGLIAAGERTVCPPGDRHYRRAGRAPLPSCKVSGFQRFNWRAHPGNGRGVPSFPNCHEMRNTRMHNLRQAPQALLKRWGPPVLLLLAFLAFVIWINQVEKTPLVSREGQTFEKAVVTEILRTTGLPDGSGWGSSG